MGVVVLCVSLGYRVIMFFVYSLLHLLVQQDGSCQLWATQQSLAESGADAKGLGPSDSLGRKMDGTSLAATRSSQLEPSSLCHTSQ